MIRAEEFIQAAKLAGFGLYTGVPCSYLKPFINKVIDSDDLRYVGVTNEGDAVALASGAEVAGVRSVVMFQNSGFGNTVNPLTSLNAIFKIPVLVIATLRGEPGGKPDEPQHALMGEITPGLFDLMKIPWEYFPSESSQIHAVLERAIHHMTTNRLPYGLIMKNGTVEDYKLKSKPVVKPLQKKNVSLEESQAERPKRADVLAAVQRASSPKDLIVATTGFTGRVLYALEDRGNQLYMVGSMGCASSFGLGMALAKPQLRTIILDGDGAALMRMGAMATLGYERPKNLIHILLDNEVHDSTGGQATVSHSINLGAIAEACGYPKVIHTNNVKDIETILSEPTDELIFISVKVQPGESGDLPRPTITPEFVAERMRKHIADVST